MVLPKFRERASESTYALGRHEYREQAESRSGGFNICEFEFEQKVDKLQGAGWHSYSSCR